MNFISLKPFAPGLCHRAGMVGIAGLVMVANSGCSGTQARMVGTKRVLAMSQPTQKPVAHRVERIDAVTIREDGSLVVMLHGRLSNSGDGAPEPCTLLLPAVALTNKTESVARRIVVSNASLIAGWDNADPASPGSRSVPLGPTLSFAANESYNWSRLQLLAGQNEEVRLVKRPGSVGPWEILVTKVGAELGSCRFTVYEVRPQMVAASNRAALALLPVAVAEDLVANTGRPTGAVASVVGLPLLAVAVAPVGVVKLLFEGAKRVGQALGLAKEESPSK